MVLKTSSTLSATAAVFTPSFNHTASKSSSDIQYRLLKKLQNLEVTIRQLFAIQRPLAILREKLDDAHDVLDQLHEEDKSGVVLATAGDWDRKLADWWRRFVHMGADEMDPNGKRRSPVQSEFMVDRFDPYSSPSALSSYLRQQQETAQNPGSSLDDTDSLLLDISWQFGQLPFKLVNPLETENQRRLLETVEKISADVAAKLSADGFDNSSNGQKIRAVIFDSAYSKFSDKLKEIYCDTMEYQRSGGNGSHSSSKRGKGGKNLQELVHFLKDLIVEPDAVACAKEATVSTETKKLLDIPPVNCQTDIAGVRLLIVSIYNCLHEPLPVRPSSIAIYEAVLQKLPPEMWVAFLDAYCARWEQVTSGVLLLWEMRHFLRKTILEHYAALNGSLLCGGSIELTIAEFRAEFTRILTLLESDPNNIDHYRSLLRTTHRAKLFYYSLGPNERVTAMDFSSEMVELIYVRLPDDSGIQKLLTGPAKLSLLSLSKAIAQYIADYFARRNQEYAEQIAQVTAVIEEENRRNRTAGCPSSEMVQFCRYCKQVGHGRETCPNVPVCCKCLSSNHPARQCDFDQYQRLIRHKLEQNGAHGPNGANGGATKSNGLVPLCIKCAQLGHYIGQCTSSVIACRYRSGDEPQSDDSD